MLDAQSANPLVGDSYAENFLGDEGKEVFRLFRDFRNPNGSNLTRCHLIDQIVQSTLNSAPRSQVVLVGAGFDSRAFRLRHGRWLELDEASVIDRKERIAPAASAPNPLTRIAIDFARDRLTDVLASHATKDPVIVIVEGVLMYLDPTKISELAVALRDTFPVHTLVCDLMQRRFFESYSRPIHEVIQSLGAQFRWTVDNPQRAIQVLGYRLRESVSIPLRAAELKRIPIPAFVIRRLLPSLRDGYCVGVFERV